MLNECVSFLSKDQLEKFIRFLDDDRKQMRRERLPKQWELAVLYSLNKMGTITHEPEMGSRKPDIFWHNIDDTNGFVADVTTVSDKGFDEENPHEFYHEEVRRRVSKRGFFKGNFALHPKGVITGDYGDGKAKLLYPKKSDADKLFGEGFELFLAEIRHYSLERHQKRLRGDGYDVTITFDKGHEHSTAGHLSYKTYYSLTNNTIANALEAKCKQLKSTNFQGPLGIFLTDGGCRSLSSKLKDYTGRAYTSSDVIIHFLKKNPEISFVFVVSTFRGSRFMGQDEHLRFGGELYLNPSAKFIVNECTANAIMRIHDIMPNPMVDCLNAANRINNGWDGPKSSQYAGTQIMESDKEIEFQLSSRSLLELLAGEIDLEAFLKINFGNGFDVNLFQNRFNSGYVIDDLGFKSIDLEDDDLFTLKLSADVSNGPYQMPQKRK